MFAHLGIIIKDADKSLPFYEACLAPLGIRKTQDQPQWRAAVFMIPGTGSFLWIGAGAADQPQQRLTGYFHLAFSASDEAAVRAFYDAALSAGERRTESPDFVGPATSR